MVIYVFLFGLNLYLKPNNLWSLGIVFGWGFALALRAIRIFLPNIFFSKEWEEKRINEFLEK